MTDLLHDRVRLRQTGATARLTLAHPEAGNSLDLRMAQALLEAATRLHDSQDLAVVRLDAEGRFFCVGGDLAEFSSVADAGAHVARVAEAAHGALTALRALPCPVVTVVQGAAAGGGLGLALAGDVVLAAAGVRLRVAYTAAGLSPDCGVSYRLGRDLPPAVAADLALTNRSLTAEQALQLGLVSRVVDDAELDHVAGEVVEALALGAREALVVTKALLRAAAAGSSWEQHLDAEASAIADLVVKPDGQEGLAAFLGKRRPAFSGGDPSTARPASTQGKRTE